MKIFSVFYEEHRGECIAAFQERGEKRMKKSKSLANATAQQTQRVGETRRSITYYGNEKQKTFTSHKTMRERERQRVHDRSDRTEGSIFQHPLSWVLSCFCYLAAIVHHPRTKPNNITTWARKSAFGVCGNLWAKLNFNNNQSSAFHISSRCLVAYYSVLMLLLFEFHRLILSTYISGISLTEKRRESFWLGRIWNNFSSESSARFSCSDKQNF